MTLPQNVKDAVESLECEIADPADCTAWQTIRAHLMSREAEIERLREDRDSHQRVAIKAESRLAAANALLREAIGWNWLDDGPRPDVMDVLDQKIQAHLQGDGDEA